MIMEKIVIIVIGSIISDFLAIVIEIFIFWLLVIIRKKIIELWKLTKKNTKTSLKG
jgi:hypothetical protein